jgi:hypothetical protein
MNTSMASDHPFQMLFETLGRIPTTHAESVNRHAYEILCDILTVPVDKAGRCILLRAPRAGHGKTHLLSRIQHYLGSTHEFIPLHPSFGCRIDARSVTDDALRRLVRPLPASGGLCVLDLVTRRLFAAALQPLVASGEVPCQDREGALAALRTRPIETFDFHHASAVTAHWARENFEVLGQRLSLELSQRCGLPIREVAFWVDALFRFAATPIENPGRVRALSELVHGGNLGEGEALERLSTLLGLLSLLMRVVLVADDLEGFSADESAALRLASFLGSVRQSVERLDVILSLNQDIWQSAFMPRLSGGLSDRLSEVVIELHPLTEPEMVALLDSRVPGLGSRVLDRIDVSAAGTHARGLIRAAGMEWLKATAMDSTPPVQPAAIAAPVAPQIPEPVPAPVTVAPERPVSWPPPEVKSEAAPSETLKELPASSNRQDFPEVNKELEGIPQASSLEIPADPVAVETPQVDLPYLSDAPIPDPENASPIEIQPAPDSPFRPEVDSPFRLAEVTDAARTSPIEQILNAPSEAPMPNPSSDTEFGSPNAPEVAPAESPAFASPAAQSQDYSSLARPVAKQEFESPSPANEAAVTPPAAADTDRVDELLRQFRERYGRGSL